MECETMSGFSDAIFADFGVRKKENCMWGNLALNSPNRLLNYCDIPPVNFLEKNLRVVCRFK